MATKFLYLILLYIILDITKGLDLCGDKLLPTIPDDHITASSSLFTAGGKGHSGPERGRLNTQQTIQSNGTVLMGGWAPAADSKGQYIQAMFNDLTYIESIITQGQNPAGGFVKLYRLEYTEDGKNWKPVDMVSIAGVEQIFKGNDDADTPVEGELDCPVFAKGIRIYPLEWESHIALRFDVKGCYVDNTVVATMPPPISTTVTTTPATPVTTPTTKATPPTTTVTTPTIKTTPTTEKTSTPSTVTTTKSTTMTTTPVTTPITTPITTSPPFLPGILTPFALPTTTPVTTLQPVTGAPRTTVNLLTLIHWFLTALSNSSLTTLPMTTPLTTLPTTRATTLLTTLPTTRATTPSTPLTTMPTTKKTTTAIPPFMPGIQNPFGTTKRP